MLIAVIALVLAACSGGATTAPTIPSDATSSITPAATGTPVPSTAASPSAAAVTFPLTLTDDEGTSVTIAKEPAKIVSLTPATTETLFALGVGDRIVGKGSDFFLYPPAASAIPDVQAFDGTQVKVDVEKIAQLAPDVVFAGGNFGTPPDDIERLRSLGLPVVVVYAPTIQKVLDDVSLTGDAVGKPAEADAISGEMQAGFDAVSASVKNLPKPRVFYELDATGAIYGPADESFLAEMIAARRRRARSRPARRTSSTSPSSGSSPRTPRSSSSRDAPVRRHGGAGRRAARLERDDRGQERRHPPDRRPDRDPARAAADARPRAARADDPSRRARAVAFADPPAGSDAGWPPATARSSPPDSTSGGPGVSAAGRSCWRWSGSSRSRSRSSWASGWGRSRSRPATRSRSSPTACSGSTSARPGRRRPRRSSGSCACRAS